MSGQREILGWILATLITGLLAVIFPVDSNPLSSKAASWMSTADDSRSYSHIGGGSKFGKVLYSSHPPRSNYQTTGSNSSNKTLAAILFLSVFGIGATALLVILCSKMTKTEKYDTMQGTVY